MIVIFYKSLNNNAHLHLHIFYNILQLQKNNLNFLHISAYLNNIVQSFIKLNIYI